MFDYVSALFDIMRRLLKPMMVPLRWYFVEHYKLVRDFMRWVVEAQMHAYMATRGYVAWLFRYGYIYSHFLLLYLRRTCNDEPIPTWFPHGAEIQPILCAKWEAYGLAQLCTKDFWVAWCNSWTRESTWKWVKSCVFWWRRRGGNGERQFGKPRPLAHLVNPVTAMQPSLLMTVDEYEEARRNWVDELVQGAGLSEEKEVREPARETGMRKQNRARKRNRKRK